MYYGYSRAQMYIVRTSVSFSNATSTVAACLSRSSAGAAQGQPLRRVRRRGTGHRPAVPLRLLPPRLQEVEPPQAAHPLSHWREAVRVHPVQQVVRVERRAQGAHQDAHRPQGTCRAACSRRTSGRTPASRYVPSGVLKAHIRRHTGLKVRVERRAQGAHIRTHTRLKVRALYFYVVVHCRVNCSVLVTMLGVICC